MAAIRHGFDLEKVIGDPDWGRFVADSDLRPVLAKGGRALRERAPECVGG